MADSPEGDDGPRVESKISALEHGQLHEEHCTQADQDSLPTFAVYASSSLNLGTGVRIVGGNVGVRDPDEPTDQLLYQLRVGENARIDLSKTTFAKDVLLTTGSKVGALKTDAAHLERQGTATHGALSAFPASTPIPPVVAALPVPMSASSDITIPMNNMSRPPYAANSYRDVTVRENGLLQLLGGNYVFRSLSVGKNARILALASTTITVNELIGVGESARVAPASGLTAKDLIIRAAAGPQGSNQNGEIPALRFGPNAIVRALIIAPQAHLRWNDLARLRGALLARSSIWTLGNADSADPASVIWEDGIPGEACEPYDCSGPPVDDADPCTVYACTPEWGPAQVPAPDGTTCDFDGDPGACLLGECEELCNSAIQQIVGDPYHGVIVPAMQATPAGKYLVKYVTDCMKYNPLWWWSVNAVEDGEFTWFLVEANDRTVLPGTFGFFNNASGGPTPRDKPGFPTQAQCIAENQLQPPIVVDHLGNDLMGIKLFDHPYTDNRTGPMGLRPTWSLTPFGACEQ